MRKDIVREEAIKLVISAIQAAPEIAPKGMSADNLASYLTNCAKKIIEYVEPISMNAHKPD
jgi:hypothetical protein